MQASCTYPSSTPEHLTDSKHLVSILQKKSISEIRSLMHLSDKLAELNYQRYQSWNPDIEENTRPAMYCFKGDVYQGLEAEQFNQQQVKFASPIYVFFPVCMVFLNH